MKPGSWNFDVGNRWNFALPAAGKTSPRTEAAKRHYAGGSVPSDPPTGDENERRLAAVNRPPCTNGRENPDRKIFEPSDTPYRRMSTRLWVVPVSSRKLPLSPPNVRLTNGLLKTEVSIGMRVPPQIDVSALAAVVVATNKTSGTAANNRSTAHPIILIQGHPYSCNMDLPRKRSADCR